MNVQYEYQLNQQHRNQMLREAENERLAQDAQLTPNRPIGIVAALGRTMVKVGEKLQGEPEAHYVPARTLEAR